MHIVPRLSVSLFRIIFINDKTKNEGNWVKTELNVLSGCPITVRTSQGKIQLAGEIVSFEIPPNVPCLGNFSCRRGNISSLFSQIRGAKRVDRRVLLHTATNRRRNDVRRVVASVVEKLNLQKCNWKFYSVDDDNDDNDGDEGAH